MLRTRRAGTNIGDTPHSGQRSRSARPMYTQADGAWIKNAAEEARMVDAMRKTPEMIVTGESGKGTKSTDRYSLKGLSQALDRVATECK